jgi:type II secretory pathway pseudopilin PulG
LEVFDLEKIYKDNFCLMFMRKVIRNKGQVWVETVIYTLIGLTIIGIVMAAALPKINSKKDEMIVGQSIEALRNIDAKIRDAQKVAGNRRIVDLEIKKGKFIIDMEKDTISWIMNSRFQYSELGVPISLGWLNVTTREGDPWEIEIKTEYFADLRYEGSDIGTKQLDISPTAYKFSIENKEDIFGVSIIDFKAT